jgi:hypothetical protein
MSLHKYELSFSSLSQSDKIELMNRIDKVSWNGLDLNPKAQVGQFFLDESLDPSILKIPDSCHLVRIYH